MKKLYLVLGILLAFTLAPCSHVSAKAQNSRSTGVYLNKKKIKNGITINLDSEGNYLRLKGNWKNYSLRTNNKKVKLEYWGESKTCKEWDAIGKKSGTTVVRVLNGKKVISSFKIKIRKPKIVVKNRDTRATLILKGAGYSNNTVHKVKWYFTPVGHYGNQTETIVDSDNFNKTFLFVPGKYRVKAVHLGKTYRLKKTVLIKDSKNDFEVKSLDDLRGKIPAYIINSLKVHKYKYSIVRYGTLAQYDTAVRDGWVVNGIHDIDERRIVVCNTSSSVAIHEVGHFISCSFQKTNGINLTQTNEWQMIYMSERNRFQDVNSFSQVGDTYASTSANEFFAECFQQFYLYPKKLRKKCPMAYRFIKRTVEIDFPRIANINW